MGSPSPSEAGAGAATSRDRVRAAIWLACKACLSVHALTRLCPCCATPAPPLTRTFAYSDLHVLRYDRWRREREEGGKNNLRAKVLEMEALAVGEDKGKTMKL